MGLELPDLDFLPEPQFEPETFERSAAPSDGHGFAGRRLERHQLVIGGSEQQLLGEPLPFPAGMEHATMVRLHDALAVLDPDLFVYAAARYFHLGLPILTVAVQTGQPGGGARRVEYRAKDGFVTFIAEGAHTAVKILCDDGHDHFDRLAKASLATAVRDLTPRETGLAQL